MAAFLTALALVGVVGHPSSVGAKGLKSSAGEFRKLREGAGSFRSMQDGGTYNPKSAWMMVDSRRRVLPDIDVEEHFASVESHILSDIHNYHMGEFQRRRLEDEEWDEDWEDQLSLEDRIPWPRRRVGHYYEGEEEDEYLEDQYLPDEYQYQEDEEEEEYPDYPGYRWSLEKRGRYRESPRGQHDYPIVADYPKLDYPSVSSKLDYPLQSKLDYPSFPDYDPYYDSPVSVSTAEPIITDEAADRQFTTVGLANPPGHSVLGITSHSAVGLLGLLLFINILRDVIQQITGGRRKRREVLEEEEKVESKDRVANMLLRAERNFKRLQ